MSLLLLTFTEIPSALRKILALHPTSRPHLIAQRKEENPRLLFPRSYLAPVTLPGQHSFTLYKTTVEAPHLVLPFYTLPTVSSANHLVSSFYALKISVPGSVFLPPPRPGCQAVDSSVHRRQFSQYKDVSSLHSSACFSQPSTSKKIGWILSVCLAFQFLNPDISHFDYNVTTPISPNLSILLRL